MNQAVKAPSSVWKPSNAQERLCIALDFPTEEKAIGLVNEITYDLPGCLFKVGKELFEVVGPNIVEGIIARRGNVFRDGKFHDIPNTVAGATAAATRNGCVMLNVHIGGGKEMMQAAVQAAATTAQEEEIPRPAILGVTVLTSIDDKILNEEVGIPGSVANEVVRRAKLAQEAGADGVVASAKEVALIREACGHDFLVVTPGIRLPENEVGDQKRVVGPTEAIAAGSDIIVVGRPITKATDPIATAKAFVHMIEEGLAVRQSAL